MTWLTVNINDKQQRHEFNSEADATAWAAARRGWIVARGDDSEGVIQLKVNQALASKHREKLLRDRANDNEKVKRNYRLK